MRTLGGVLLGLLLFFPGVLLLQWIAVNVLNAYDKLSVTDGCLVMIMILLSVHLVRGQKAAQPARATKPARPRRQVQEFPAEPQLEYLPGQEGRRARSSRRQASTGRRRHS